MYLHVDSSYATSTYSEMVWCTGDGEGWFGGVAPAGPSLGALLSSRCRLRAMWKLRRGEGVRGSEEGMNVEGEGARKGVRE